MKRWGLSRWLPTIERHHRPLNCSRQYHSMQPPISIGKKVAWRIHWLVSVSPSAPIETFREEPIRSSVDIDNSSPCSIPTSQNEDTGKWNACSNSVVRLINTHACKHSPTKHFFSFKSLTWIRHSIWIIMCPRQSEKNVLLRLLRRPVHSNEQWRSKRWICSPAPLLSSRMSQNLRLIQCLTSVSWMQRRWCLLYNSMATARVNRPLCFDLPDVFFCFLNCFTVILSNMTSSHFCCLCSSIYTFDIQWRKMPRYSVTIFWVQWPRQFSWQTINLNNRSMSLFLFTANICSNMHKGKQMPDFSWCLREHEMTDDDHLFQIYLGEKWIPAANHFGLWWQQWVSALASSATAFILTKNDAMRPTSERNSKRVSRNSIFFVTGRMPDDSLMICVLSRAKEAKPTARYFQWASDCKWPA